MRTINDSPKEVLNPIQLFWSSQLFIAFCAVIFTWEAGYFLHDQLSPDFLFWQFFSCAAIYNAYYWHNRSFPLARFLTILFTFLSIGITVLMRSFFYERWVWVLLIALMACLYFWPNKWRFAAFWSSWFVRTILLTLIWFIYTCIFPFNSVDIWNHHVALLFFRLLFLLLIILPFTLRDCKQAKEQIQIVRFAQMTYVAGMLCAFSLFTSENKFIAWACLFTLLVLVGLYGWIQYQKPGNAFYLFWLDGLMIFHVIFIRFFEYLMHESG